MEEEATRLHARFDTLKADGMGQAEFARTFNVPGGASMVSQHIKGRRPISLEAVTAYAKGFKCRVDDISPRLAKEIASLTQVHQATSIQPSSSFGTPAAKATLGDALEVLASSLNELPDTRREIAAQHLQTLARAPDSQKARDAIMAVLTPAPRVPVAETSDFAPPVPTSAFARKTTAPS